MNYTSSVIHIEFQTAKCIHTYPKIRSFVRLQLLRGMLRRWQYLCILVVLITLFFMNLSSRSLSSFQPTTRDLSIATNINNSSAFGNFTNLNCSNLAIIEAQQREYQSEQEYQLTAIVLHWKRSEGVRYAVHRLFDSHLFKEVIVWNNNPQINLTVDAIAPNKTYSSTSIRIINSKENIKDEAKYRACCEAKTPACYYADDDWDTSDYIRSLVASFRSDPTRLHSVTNPITYYTNLMWSYFDPQIDLHTGFSWIGCGSVFLREHAQRHLQLLHHYLEKDPSKTNKTIAVNQRESTSSLGLLNLSDVFFSLWLNQVPILMNANIRELPGASRGPSFSSTANFYELQYRSSVSAIRILEKALRLNQSNSTVSFPRQLNHRFPTYVKSPGPKNSFVFYSNILPLDFERIPFNITLHFERGTAKNYPQAANVRHFLSYGTVKAVDSDTSTCWHTHREIRPGDFFAIDFLHVRTNITFSLVVAHNLTMQTSLETSISLDGVQWLPYRSLQGIMFANSTLSNPKLQTILFHSAQFTPGCQTFRHISFRAVSHSASIWKVCEIQLDTNLGHK